MKAGDARSASRNTRAICAAFASLLLASCTTSGPVRLANPSFTNEQPGVAGLLADAAASTAAATPQTAAAAASLDAGVAVPNATQEGATLPAEVAYAPAPNPGAQGLAETATPTPEAVPSQAPATSASVADAQDAPSSERFGAPAAQPAEPKKRGFLASIFAAPEPQPAAAAAAPEAAEEPAGQATAAVPAPEPATPPAVESAGAAEEKAAEQPEAEAPAQVAAAEPATSAAPSAQKRGFLASFFAPAPTQAAPAAPKPLIAEKAEPKIASASAKPLVTLASIRPADSFEDDGGLPGVRADSLFEITRKSGLDDDSDIDLHEDEGGPVQLASAAGLARLAPNGLLKQREDVDVACLKPSLVRMLKTVERHYGKRMIVTSGYRSPQHNRRVRGARNSMHMHCAAVDAQVPGVSKWELAKFVRAMPGRGGVGTYCHTNSVHIDVGPERDWNWRCRRRK